MQEFLAILQSSGIERDPKIQIQAFGLGLTLICTEL